MGKKAVPKITEDANLLLAAPEDRISVPIAWWKRIMDRIKQIGQPPILLENFAWLCFGFSGSALLAGLSFLPSVPFKHDLPNGGSEANYLAIITEVLFFCLFIFMGLLGAALLYSAKIRRKQQATLCDWLTEDMQHHLDRHVQENASATTGQK